MKCENVAFMEKHYNDDADERHKTKSHNVVRPAPNRHNLFER